MADSAPNNETAACRAIQDVDVGIEKPDGAQQNADDDCIVEATVAEAAPVNGEKGEEAIAVVEREDSDEDIREGETPEAALQRRIEEGRIGKGKTLRRWRDTEEKQRRLENGRHESKVQRYDQIYEEVRALRKETRHSVRNLRERFNKEGLIQNKDQFIVRLIAQERNEHEGKVAAIRSLQQWRLTDVELHNFINRCHRKGLDGKLDLAMQWAFEQEEAGGEVNFKEGLAFYSSIGILQPRSSAHTQQQWREWREWEDAMTSAVEKRRSRGNSVDPSGSLGASDPGADASCNDDSTVCNSPWSSERGGGGGSFSGTLRSSSAHGEGDVAGGYGTSRFYQAGLSGTAPEATQSTRLRRGRMTASQASPRQKRGWWQWRSYSPPGPMDRQKSEDLRRASADKKAAMAALGATGGIGAGSATPPRPSIGGRAGVSLAATAPIPLPGVAAGLEPSADVGGRPTESIVRAGGGYLPPRHPLASLSPASTPGRRSGALGAAGDGIATTPTRVGNGVVAAEGRPTEADPGDSERMPTEEDPGDAEREPKGAEAGKVAAEPELTISAAPLGTARRGVVARGAARTRAKGPAGGGTPKPAGEQPDIDLGDAPTEEKGPAGRGTPKPAGKQPDIELGDAPTEEEGTQVVTARRKRMSEVQRYGRGRGKAVRGEDRPRSTRSISGFMSGFADWLMPGVDENVRRSRLESGDDTKILHIDVYGPSTPPPRATKSAPVTPRGRPKTLSVLREGGWFYNGDSDYSSSEEDNFESDDEGFWGDAGTTEPVGPRTLGGGGGKGILERLRMLFT